MGNKPTVVLYGVSLVIEGLAASLGSHPDLSLHRINGRGLFLAEQLTALRPDVVIFDLVAAPPDNAFLSLWEQPQVLLIGVDLNRHEMFQWVGQCARAQTTQDVIRAIQGWTKAQGQ